MVRLNRFIIQLLAITGVLVCLIAFQLPDGNLHIITCDVGQGDGILITYKDFQIVNDGGTGNKILDCLSEHIPFYDRTIELVILSHPQKDHYGGLVEVFKRYKVENYLHNDIKVSSSDYELLTKEVGREGAKGITPGVGRGVKAGLIYLDIVNPPEGFESKELNDYSITYYLKYGKFKAIFTGDLSPVISEQLVALNQVEQVNYIKVPHHGSKVGMTENLLKALMPKVATISVGKNNNYGHPSPEILEMLKKYNIKTYRTDLEGTIELVTDGEKIWKRNN